MASKLSSSPEVVVVVAAAGGEDGQTTEVVCCTETETQANVAPPMTVAGEEEDWSKEQSDRCGEDELEEEGNKGFGKKDMEFRATLPKWVLELIDAEIDVPGLEISNRPSDFYEADEEDDKSGDK